MNISNGHNGAQGHTLPEKHNTGAFAYGLSEDSFGKLTRARNACDMLQLLFSEYPSQAGALDAGCAHGVAALMEYPASLTGSVQHISGKDFPAGSLLLPLTTNTGAVTGAQLIAPTGEKSILPGSTMKGAFVSLSPLPSEPPVQVVITEGYATALTVSQLTAGCVVAAISAGNLPNVAQSLRARWPEVKIIIAGDNDFQDGGENPGRAFAERAAKAVGGWMTLPPGEIKADWNDFHREHGITRAREAFRNGLVLCGEGRTQLPHGFRLTQEYLWYEKQVQRNGETEIQNVKICSPLRVTAITCDADGGNFGRQR